MFEFIVLFTPHIVAIPMVILSAFITSVVVIHFATGRSDSFKKASVTALYTWLGFVFVFIMTIKMIDDVVFVFIVSCLPFLLILPILLSKRHKKHPLKAFLIAIMTLIVTTIVFVVLSLVGQNIVGERYFIKGTTMLPNYQVDSLVTTHLKNTEINRGDVVVYNHQTADGRVSERTNIDRVVAIGGDVLLVRNGILYVNDTPLRPTRKDPLSEDSIEIIIPERSYYLLGDNSPKTALPPTLVLRDRIIGVVKQDKGIHFRQPEKLVGKIKNDPIVIIQGHVTTEEFINFKPAQ